MLIKTPALNDLPGLEAAPRAAPPDELRFRGVRAREATAGAGARRRACMIRFDLKPRDLATLAGDLYKSNILIMTHLGSVASS